MHAVQQRRVHRPLLTRADRTQGLTALARHTQARRPDIASTLYVTSRASADHLASRSAAQEPQEAPSAGSGKFYYSADSTYDGEWTLAEAAAQGEVEGAEGVQEGEEAPAAAAPAKLRHGKVRSHTR